MQDIPFDRTPVIKMLSAYLGKEAVSFHMPGHTNGKSFSKWLHENALSIDTTELESTDDLHRPGNAVKEAYSLAAKAFGAKETFFVTTGSTTAIYAAILSVTVPGDKVIMFRNVHQSILNACIMFDLDPVFTTEETIRTTLGNHPDAAAVFVTRPDYYGRCIDIESLSSLVHEADKILIVDEAHGTHFAFCPSCLPVPAVSNGADIVIQSAHKTAPALTQASYLHLSCEAVRLDRIHPARVKEALSIISTSSPSFLIAATLDFARAFLEEYGDHASKALLSNLNRFYSLLDPRWLPCFEHPAEKESGVAFDPFRMVITIRNMPFTAKDLCGELSGQGISVEFHDLLRVVLICKFENTIEDFVLLARVMNCFLKRKEKQEGFSGNKAEEPLKDRIKELESLDRQFQYAMDSFPERVILPHCGISQRSRAESIPLREAAQRVLFSAIVPYPPGIPMIWPGEVLTGEAVFLLEALLAYGYSIYGIENSLDGKSGDVIPSVRCIREDAAE